MDDDAPPGVPEWVVTYGDMMSLLLTFFIMLVSMSEVVAEQKYRAVLASLAEYLGHPAAPLSPSGQNFPLNSLAEQRDTLGSHTDEHQGRGGLRRQALDGEDVRVFRNREGEPVPAGTIHFPANSAELTAAGRLELAAIAQRLAGKPNKIDICGVARDSARASTSTPKPTALPSEPVEAPRPQQTMPTDLAYQRAKTVLRALEATGIRHDRLRISTDIEAPTTDNFAHADRVDVTALDAYVSEIVGPREE